MENIDDVNISGFLELSQSEAPKPRPKGLIERLWERKLVRGAAIAVATLALLSPLERDAFDYGTTRAGTNIANTAFTDLYGLAKPKISRIEDQAQEKLTQAEQNAPNRFMLAMCNYAVEHHVSRQILEAANVKCPDTIPNHEGAVH